jgi:hypothetical protein
VAVHLSDQPETFDRYRFPDLIREFARHRAEVDEPPAARSGCAVTTRVQLNCLFIDR